MINDKIELVIPTYNRGKYLDETLNCLLNSPFRDCKITIRDNASQDNTPEICEKYSKLFKNIHIIRNEMNIGGSANIVMSYREATCPYVWVLADNDCLNFDRCDDLIKAIESYKYDLIICSSAIYSINNWKNNIPNFDESISQLIKDKRNGDSNYLENNAKDLALIMKKHYFYIAPFLPSTIYKTSLIDSDTLRGMYDAIHQSLPHYPLIAKALNDNLKTYKTKYDIVFVQPNPDSFDGISDFTLYSRVLECATLIEDKKIQSYALQWGLYSEKVSRNIPLYILNNKRLGDTSFKINVLSLVKTMYLIKGSFKGFFYQIYIFTWFYFPLTLLNFVANIMKLLK